MSTCESWTPSPFHAHDYRTVLRKFGCTPDIEKWASEYADKHAGRLKWDVEFLLENYKFDRLLNVGGAPFVFEHLLRQMQHGPFNDRVSEIVSIDLAPERFPNVGGILFMQAMRADIETAYADNIRRVIGKFPIVVFAEIFEHLRHDLLGTISTLRELVSDDGILYLTTPNGNGLYAQWERLHGRTGSDPAEEWGKLRSLGHMGHVREYSAKEVVRVLEICGFKVDRVIYRRASRNGTWRNTVAGMVKGCVTSVMPWLGDEIVIVARRDNGKMFG